ncbi:MAG: 4-hydroxy-tetrahydrodipicolinate reductase [Longimonas sp.]|uniref:4-hydroxy-tetrahydrodipicolinate reductase n=1 Tax=Longimonas sp. TaxID=2039626 RepID=UPI00334AAB68
MFSETVFDDNFSVSGLRQEAHLQCIRSIRVVVSHLSSNTSHFIMTIALVGTGQTGSVVAEQVRAAGHTLIATYDAERPLLDADPEPLTNADVVIDFSLPSLALDHIERYCTVGVPAVVGTTGWYESLDTVQELVDTHEAALLYAPNFSVGVAVLRRAVQKAATLMDALPEYDAFVHEVHHRKKVDSPSGTAQMLGEVVRDALQRKTHIDAETQHDRIDPEALHVSSTRVGSVFGEHTVAFDSPHDQLRLSHTAKGRTGFAAGALAAAEWLPGRTGLFTLNDMLDHLLND